MTGRAKDITGRIFGRLTVVARAGVDQNKRALWRCKCVCGNETTTAGYRLRNGHTKSCGCLHSDVTKYGNRRRGMWRGGRGSPLNVIPASHILEEDDL